MPLPLPVDPFVPAIVEGVRRRRAAVVVAAPGAGKTTRVPAALANDGPVLLLQPRRVAARSIARRIAVEQNWTIGREVGWHVRFEHRFGPDTRLLVATEGMLTARLQQDPLLSGFATVVLDEFHERSIHADLGIALAKQAWRARDDLRVVVMSATLDAERAAAFLDECPIFTVPGRQYPLEIAYRPSLSVAEGVREVLSLTRGQVLCFLAGAAEVRRAATEIRAAVPSIDVVELHGSLPPEEQDRAIAAAEGRRVIVSTNVAETSLTVPGVTAVIDTGQHKVARYDARRGVDSLHLERISRDSADQRAGRAARIAAGIALRLWDERDKLRPHREPDVARVDLSGPVLDVLAWGGDPRAFQWFEPPAEQALSAALELLRALGAIEGNQLTNLGRSMARLAAHPRLARILVETGAAFEAAVACAVLSERQALPRHPATTTCDLLVSDAETPPHITRHARELQRSFGSAPRQHSSERELRQALLAGYPDRVAQRRAPGDPRVLLASGHGAVIGTESGVRGGEFLVAIDVQAGPRGETSEARVRIASVVDKDWLEPTAIARVHEFDEKAGTLRSFERESYGALVLRERPVATDPAVLAEGLADAYLRRPRPEADAQLVNRLHFAGLQMDLREIAVRAAAGRRALHEIRLEDGLEWATRRRLDEAAPQTFTAPSGRSHPLEYREDGSVSAAVKLQELFGLEETPRIGANKEPLLILLLAPNGRPVQTTRDLRSFWTSTYPQVRKELRGRYPKHPWPEDPWNAAPTARTIKR